MRVTFKQAEDFEISAGFFIAAWKVWFKRFSPTHDAQRHAWKYGKMPIGLSDKSLSDLIRQDRRFTLEVLARMMVPWAYRNNAQVDDTFLRDHIDFLKQATIGYDSGSEEPAACLSDHALAFWDSMSFAEQDTYMNYAEARVQADIEVKSDDPVVLDDQGIELIGEDTYPPYIPEKEADDLEFVRALVRWIEDAPYQAYYLKKPAGEAVAGWHDRLLAYFWPKPRISYALHYAAVDPLSYRANELAKTLERGEDWDDEWREMAVKTVTELFNVSGTPQKEVTVDNIKKVIKAAINADANSDAKMNSGWTYLAALCTAHLEGQPDRLPLISWNSRVASSVISRLDFLLAEAGVKELGNRFQNIGTVPGWGGTRPRQYTLQWPKGYRSWKTQIAGSKLANQIVHILNTETKPNGEKRYRLMPLAGGGKGPWTVRGIQRVLFSDGY
ncbi:MAG TPA: hypothetical protein VIM93_05105 [Kangiella sp.]